MKTKFSAIAFFSLTASALVFAVLMQGCGVRGRPQAPLIPSEIGRGEPNFKRATEEFAFPVVPSPTPSGEPKSDQEGN